jgi:hypothetical protein
MPYERLTQLNAKLYAIAKVQSDKSCPLVANVPRQPNNVIRRLRLCGSENHSWPQAADNEFAGAKCLGCNGRGSLLGLQCVRFGWA